MRRWSGYCAALVVALGWLAACSSGSQNPGSGPSPEPDPNQFPETECVPDQYCFCQLGSQGATVCDSGTTTCKCTQCPALELHNSRAIDGCGGEPFGTWRLTTLDLGASKLSLSSFGMPIGDCDLSTQLIGAVPNALMTLSDGGDAEYFSQEAPTKTSWSESCVTSNVPQFTCGASVWTGVSNCKLSCDTCSCDSSTSSASTDNGRWQRTASTLTLSQWGKPVSFDYCLTGGLLELSTDGVYLVYEPVNTLNAPKACAGRSAAQCTAGQGCSLGVCVGGAACAQAQVESACLTMQGCTWDAMQCQGKGQLDCRLADFGKVPGCDFVDKPLTCTGTRPACSTLDSQSCEAAGGCSLNKTGRCSGPSLPCEDFFACPIGYCDDLNGCSGVTTCGAFKTEPQCSDANDNLPDPSCKWEASWCEGEPVPCAQLSQEDCASAPGCALAPAP